MGRRRDKSAFISIRLCVTAPPAQMSACRLMQRAANLSIDCQMWVMLCRIWSDPHVKVTPEQIHFQLFTSCYVRQKKPLCVCETHIHAVAACERRLYGSIIPVLHYRSIPVLPAPFLPPPHSCHYISLAATVVGPDLEEIKNLCCFVALSPAGGRMSIKSCIMGLPHTQKTHFTQDKSIHSDTVLWAIHLLSDRPQSQTKTRYIH